MCSSVAARPRCLRPRQVVVYEEHRVKPKAARVLGHLGAVLRRAGDVPAAAKKLAAAVAHLEAAGSAAVNEEVAAF